MPYRTATGFFFQIPYMLGHGSNVVVLLPNGISAFRFADGFNFDLEAMVLAGEAIRPFPCPAGSAAPPVRQPLTASELRAELPGNTLYSGPRHSEHFNMFVATDGVLYVTIKAENASGTRYAGGRWHITPDGHYCDRGWHDRVERCSIVYREGETFAFFPKGRLWKEVYRRVPGNPEGY